MLKFIPLKILFLLLSFVAISQNISVLNTMDNMTVSGVKVYALNHLDTLQTNRYGEVNIDIYSQTSTIIFIHQFFELAKYTKEELSKQNNIIYLKPNMALKAALSSMFNAKEVSGDLPFYFDIINTEAANNSIEAFINQNVDQGGTIIFRGAESEKILFVIDGVRLNNEIHRKGKIERLFNFENTMTSRIQEIYGSGFSIYSSDATGGVIQYFTTIYPFTNDFSEKFFGEITSKFESASNSFINNINFNYLSSKFNSFTSFSYGNFGDIMMGKNRTNLSAEDSIYAFNTHYVERQNDSDVVVANPNYYLQKNTNYQQFYFLQKFRYKLAYYSSLSLNIHYSYTSDVGLYSSLTEINNNHLRFAVAKFEPQNKYFVTLNLINNRENRFYEYMSINATFNNFNEYRITRKLNNQVALHQLENINVYQLNTDFAKIYMTNRIVYGLQYSYNTVNSESFFHNILKDSIYTGLNRYPTNGSFSHNVSAYFNYKVMYLSFIHFTYSLRYGFSYLDADFSYISPQLPIDFTEKKYFSHTPALSFNVYYQPKFFRISITTSAGMQRPIIDDFAKVMVKDFVVNIPNNTLKSEKIIAGEIGVESVPIENLIFFVKSSYTKIFDAVISEQTTLNGEEKIFFGNDGYLIATKVNIPQAFIATASLGVNYFQSFDNAKTKTMLLNISTNFITSKNEKTGKSMPNISPNSANASFTLKYKSISTKITYTYNALKPIDELSIVGEDYIEKAASTGFVSWQTFNIRSSFTIKKIFKISIGIDNIFDQFYIPYKSTIVAPGRNYVFSLKIVLK
jgi:hemoglobin/transferrin/lactoferrin receptor protein